ncbi:MAG: ribonuclease [Thermoplasmata archaeon]|nr:ribonuclease [Thermoplasmata archaeon]
MAPRRKAPIDPAVLATMPVCAGMDEAGRGPVMGPIVMAGVASAEPKLFKRLGCTDSKLLSPDRRNALDRALRAESSVRIEVRVVDADVLDAERREGTSLNVIEMRRFQDIARTLAPHKAWIDAADVNEARFGRELATALPPGTEVVSQHGADLKFPIVGAASIVAKVARDKAIAELARRLERKLNLPLGSGYASDPLTQAFLKAYWAEFRELPEGTRTTWATARDLVAPKQLGLDVFTAPPEATL